MGNSVFSDFGNSMLVSRLMLALRAGLSFGGRRDYYTIFGYNRVLKPEDLIAKYERQDIASRCVNQPVDATWRFIPETDKTIDALIQLQSKLWPAIIQADRLCAFGPYSVVWFGLPGVPENPVNSNLSVKDIAYINAYGAPNVEVIEVEKNESNPRFGLPTIYRIKVVTDATSSPVVRVHWTRILHIVDRPLQGGILGIPRMVHYYNVLEDMLKVGGSAAETYWLNAHKGMQIDVDKEMSLGPDGEKALSDELDEYQHQLRRFIRTRGVKINPLGSDIADAAPTFGVLLGLLAATTNIPQRMLLGSEAGQLASEQDRANWAEYVESRRVNFAEPYILRPLLRFFANLGFITSKLPETVNFAWQSAFIQNPLEESQTMSAKARALLNLSRQSQYGTPYVGQKEGRIWLGLTPELAKDDQYPIPDSKFQGKGTQKQGGNKQTGGAGGNDGSGDTGGGAAETDTIPVSDGTADTQSN